jgi:hypothetical protein
MLDKNKTNDIPRSKAKLIINRAELTIKHTKLNANFKM